MSFKLIYVTCPNEAEAKKIAYTLVEEKLVACANILPGVTSIYEWDGKMEENREVAMLCKTTSHQVSRMVERIKELHSYQVPCVVSTAIFGGNPEYLAWVARSCSPVSEEELRA